MGPFPPHAARRSRRPGRTSLACALLLALASGRAPREPDARRTPPAAEARALFAVRARLADPPRLLVALEDPPGTQPGDPRPRPVPAAEVRAALERACALWAGPVELRLAREHETPDLLVGWRWGAHGACPAFGGSSAVAHSGPLPRLAFVHLDAERSWRVDDAPAAPGEEALLVVLAHELGHALGLDHTPDEAALMFPDARAARLAPSDRAGLASLYGGGEDAGSDLELLDERGRRRAVLRRVAPAGACDAALADLDGDGRLELVTWPSGAEAGGALVAFRFEPAAEGSAEARDGAEAERAPLRLASTLGPLPGLVPAGARGVELCRAPHGWVLLVRGPGELALRYEADASGRLQLVAADEPGAPHVLAALEGLPRAPRLSAGELRGDLDGDGRAERVRRVAPLRGDGAELSSTGR